MISESAYLHLVDAVFKRIQDACEPLDPDDVEAVAAGDVLTLTFRDRSRCVLNTQRSTRQIWLAANSRAWHFDLDEATGRWSDDKGRGDELFATLAQIVETNAGVTVRWG
jgi:CyaY protein